MPTLYIHIGHEKTGTTAIQKFLYANQEELKKQGLLYPTIGYQKFVQSSLVNSIHNLDNDCHLEFFPEGVDDNPEIVWGELVKIAQEWGKDILLSSEHFSSRLRDKGIKYIKEYLTNLLPEYEIKIIFFVRRQDEMFISRLSTLVKAGAKSPYSNWKAQVKNKDFYYDYYSIVKLWSKFFGKNNINIICYDKKIDSTNELLNFIGVNNQGFLIQQRANKSWLPLTIGIGLKINTICPNMNHVDRMAKLARINDFIEKNNINNISKKLISYTDTKEIIKLYHSDNEKMFNEYSLIGKPFTNDIYEDEYYGDVSSISFEQVINTLFRCL